ncbi:MAG TPA: zf-HC2 domain-containing protein [Bryobacteraceae bacterium]|nr:zf-HC2 domain-containing protein [Bryobacteraceae bacterium]
MSERHEPEDCKELFALLSEYLDLELPDEACAKMQAHFADCPPCVQFVESLRKTIQLLGRYRPGEIPQPLKDESKGRLRRAWEEAQG